MLLGRLFFFLCVSDLPFLIRPPAPFRALCDHRSLTSEFSTRTGIESKQDTQLVLESSQNAPHQPSQDWLTKIHAVHTAVFTRTYTVP